MMALNKFLHILVWNIFILYSCSGEYDITKFSLGEERLFEIYQLISDAPCSL